MSYVGYWCRDCEILDMSMEQATEHARSVHAKTRRLALRRQLRRMRITVTGSFSS